MLVSTTPLAFCLRDKDDEIVHVGIIHLDQLEEMHTQLNEPGLSMTVCIGSIQIH